MRRINPEPFQKYLPAYLAHDILRLAPDRREHGGIVESEDTELLGNKRAARQNLIVKRARSQLREKRLVDFEGNAIAMSPSGRVDAGIAGLRRTGWGRLIVDAFHDLDDANRLVAGRHTETLQLRAGQIGIGTGIIKNKLDKHIADIAFWTPHRLDRSCRALLAIARKSTVAQGQLVAFQGMSCCGERVGNVRRTSRRTSKRVSAA